MTARRPIIERAHRDNPHEIQKNRRLIKRLERTIDTLLAQNVQLRYDIIHGVRKIDRPL